METVIVSVVIAVLIATIRRKRSDFSRRKRGTVAPHLPEDVEGVAFRSALRVFYPHDSGSATLGRAHQSLTPAPIHTRKPEACGIERHGRVAHEAPPLRWPAFQIAKEGGVTADLDLGCTIHNDVDGALAAVPIATSGDVSSALEGLCGNGDCRESPNR